LQVGRLAAEARAVINDLAVDFSRCVVDKGHKALTLGGLLEKAIDVFVSDFSEG
jgi:hypothetical protein